VTASSSLASAAPRLQSDNHKTGDERHEERNQDSPMKPLQIAESSTALALISLRAIEKALL
jgi:hypothetical protein